MPDQPTNPVLAAPVVLPPRRVLRGDGRYGFTATVEGEDILVRNVRATWFGGASDPDDNGETASGVNTRRNPKFLGCALPMGGFRLTRGSPLPDFPWSKTRVEITDRATGKKIDVPLIDLGPSAPPHAHAAIDLTVAVFAQFGVSLAVGEMQVDYRVLGGAKHLPSPAANAGSVGLAIPLCLAAATVLGLTAIPLLGDAAPTNVQIGDFFQMLTWMGAFAGSILGIAVAIKVLRRHHVAPVAPPQPFVVTSAKEFALVRDLEDLETLVEKRHQENQQRFDSVDEKLDRNFRNHTEAQTAELKAMHERLNRVAESNAQLVGEMKHVVAAAEKASNAAVVAAEAARGAIMAASRERGSGHFSDGAHK